MLALVKMRLLVQTVLKQRRFKRYLAVALISGSFLFSLNVSGVTVKDNRLQFQTNRVAQDQNETLGQQSKQVRKLFNPEETQKLDARKDGKAALSGQQRQLFRTTKAVRTSRKQNQTPLFQASVTHTLDIKAGQDENRWNMTAVLLYSGVMLATLGAAGTISWFMARRTRQEEESTHAGD